MDKLVQILSADGWFAKIEEEDGSVSVLRVAFWGRYDGENVHELSGFVSDGADGLMDAQYEYGGRFMGYVHEGDLKD